MRFPALRTPRSPLVGAVLLVGLVARSIVGIHTIDDAFITFRYSRNIAHMGGFCYNPPERVLGTSTPLYTLALVPPAALDLDLGQAAFAVAVAADLVTIAAAVSFVLQAGYPLAALITGATLAVSPAFIEYSVSGMETSLYVALIMAALWMTGRARYGLTGVALGLAALCRPDGAVLVASIGGAILLRSPRAALRLLIPVAAIVLPWLAFATWYFGGPMPTSVLAKWALADDPLTSLRVIRAVFLSGPSLILSVLAIPGAILLWRSGRFSVRIWIAWGILYATVFTAGRAFNHYLWYFSPLLPLYFAGAAVTIDAAVRRLGRLVPRQPGFRHAAWGPVACAIFLAIAGWRLVGLRHHLEGQEVGREGLYKRIASQLGTVENRCPLAATEIGALGYYYPGPILDLAGLVSPQAIGRPAGDVLRESGACWLVTYRSHLDGLDATALPSEWFKQGYVLMERHAVGSDLTLDVYRRSTQPRGGAQ